MPFTNLQLYEDSFLKVYWTLIVRIIKKFFICIAPFYGDIKHSLELLKEGGVIKVVKKMLPNMQPFKNFARKTKNYIREIFI